MDTVPTTDEQVMVLLADLPVTLALYHIQREKGHSVEKAWRVIQEIQGSRRA